MKEGLKIYRVEFQGMWPVGNCLVLVAFNQEQAEEMAKKTGKDFYLDSDIVVKTTNILELSFRKEIKEKGFPDFSQLSCKTPKKELYKLGIYKVLETCKYPDGGYSNQWLLVGKAPAGWRVLNSLD